MRLNFRIILCLSIVLLSTILASKVFALSAAGSGDISFDGTGTILHMQSPFTIRDVYSTDCTPSIVGDFITRCNDPLDTSLPGSGITRAEDVRVTASPTAFFRVFFGCAGCSSGISVRPFDGLTLGRLTDENIVALQALIDQHGAAAIHMGINLTIGSVSIGSARSLVQIDVKPGNEENRVNTQSRGFLPVAILTHSFFNASSVDVDSIEFGISGHEISPTHATLEDVDGDGDQDLLLFFKVPETGIGCGTLFTYLRGETTDGGLIAGTDSVTTVGCQ